MDGFYTLSNIPPGRYELAISMIGYKMEREKLIIKDREKMTFNFQLIAQPIEMEGINVTWRSDKEWLKNYNLFKREFLGSSPNGASCRILNEFVLSFHRESGALLAKASQPLRIENKRLGYTITYYLDGFKSDNVSVRYAGESFYESMVARSDREKKKWHKNREKAYKGSIRHFLATLGKRFDLRFEISGDSLVEKSTWPKMRRHRRYDPLMIEGFDVFLVKKEKSGDVDGHFRSMGKNDRLVNRTQDPNELTLSFDKKLMVVYRKESENVYYGQDLISSDGPQPRQISYLLLKKDKVIIDKSGRYYETFMIEQRGYMGWERIGDKLPFDYVPED